LKFYFIFLFLLKKKRPKLIITTTNINTDENIDQISVETTTKELVDKKELKIVSSSEMPNYFVQDIQRVVLFAIIGNEYRFFPRWCKIIRPQLIKTIHLITINNISLYDYNNNMNLFKKFNKIFNNDDTYRSRNQNNSIEFVSPSANGSNFFKEFISVPLTRSEWLKIRDGNTFLNSFFNPF
jgi:hypothetical protein